MPSLIADRRHSIFGHICRLPRSTPASQALHLSIDAFTGTPPAVDWKRPLGHPRKTWLRQVEDDTGLSITACQWQVWTARCGDRYDQSITLCWSSAAVSE